jgi:Na+/H+ antiporter NhaD/arsenite permease-like protein
LDGAAAEWTTWIVFAGTYAGLAIGKIPGLHIDRAGIALAGATLMLVTGQITFRDAMSRESIDYPTLALLFGMMIVVGCLRLSGFFARLAGAAMARIRSPRALLAATIALAGALSAFLINDVVCLALSPLVLHLARRLRFDPVPHLVALATAANIGSVGTITGNPQNIYIGSHSGISYLRFALRLLPVATIGLVINYLVVAVVYRRSLAATADTQRTTDEPAEDDVPPQNRAVHRALRRKAVAVAVLTIALFFTGLPLEVVALAAAAFLLLGRVKSARIYAQVDWGLLMMFVGLFVVVHAFQVHVVSRWGIAGWHWLLDSPVDRMSLLSAGLSNLVSNVPAVLLLEPVVAAIGPSERETAWLALAMSSTLAGNLTVLGSVANLIVVENARRGGVEISFWQYCKIGVPLTLLTLALGIAWFDFVRY